MKYPLVDKNVPTISIGLFVYNGEETLEKALNSLLSQTFTDFELIISDNASSDRTQEICEKYSKLDSRIKYVRQVENIGPHGNIKYVFNQAQGRYFMWAAADDVRSPDYLEVNHNYLHEHPDYVASTSPNYYEGQESQPDNLVTFSLDGGMYERLLGFLDNCWKSHGIFYALFRTSSLRDSNVVGQSFIAADWSINIDLLIRGPVKRVSEGRFVIGLSGVSSSSDPYRPFRTRKIEYLFPLYEFSVRFYQTVKISKGLAFIEKLHLFCRLVALNLELTSYLMKAYLVNIMKQILPQSILTWIRHRRGVFD